LAGFTNFKMECETGARLELAYPRALPNGA
jgi:hypothetical protein